MTNGLIGLFSIDHPRNSEYFCSRRGFTRLLEAVTDNEKVLLYAQLGVQYRNIRGVWGDESFQKHIVKVSHGVRFTRHSFYRLLGGNVLTGDQVDAYLNLFGDLNLIPPGTFIMPSIIANYFLKDDFPVHSDKDRENVVQSGLIPSTNLADTTLAELSDVRLIVVVNMPVNEHFITIEVPFGSQYTENMTANVLVFDSIQGGYTEEAAIQKFLDTLRTALVGVNVSVPKWNIVRPTCSYQKVGSVDCGPMSLMHAFARALNISVDSTSVHADTVPFIRLNMALSILRGTCKFNSKMWFEIQERLRLK